MQVEDGLEVTEGTLHLTTWTERSGGGVRGGEGKWEGRGDSRWSIASVI